MIVCVVSVFTMRLAICRLLIGCTFTTKLELKNYFGIIYKTVIGTRNPALWIVVGRHWAFSN